MDEDIDSDDVFDGEDIWDKESRKASELEGYLEDEYEDAVLNGFMGSFSDCQSENGF